MATITRRSALVACATLAVPVRSDAAEANDGRRPVFVPLTKSPVPEIDVDTLNATRWASHEGEVWVHDNRDNLPTDYDEIDRLPSSYRHALLLALPLETTSALVRERIRRCADADSTMTDEQRATIERTVDTLTPEFHNATFEERQEKWKDGFWPSIRAVFTWEEWRRIFGESCSEDFGHSARYGGALEATAEAVGW